MLRMVENNLLYFSVTEISRNLVNMFMAMRNVNIAFSNSDDNAFVLFLHQPKSNFQTLNCLWRTVHANTESVRLVWVPIPQAIILDDHYRNCGVLCQERYCSSCYSWISGTSWLDTVFKTNYLLFDSLAALHSRNNHSRFPLLSKRKEAFLRCLVI